MTFNDYEQKKYRLLDIYNVNFDYIWFFDEINSDPQESYEDKLNKVESIASNFRELKEKIKEEVIKEISERVGNLLKDV